MPKLYTMREIAKAMERSYGEDLYYDYEGFVELLELEYGVRISPRTERRERENPNDTRRSNVSPKRTSRSSRPKRKLSAWNKFVKANSNKKIYQYANGKLKLKKMGIAYRKKKR